MVRAVFAGLCLIAAVLASPIDTRFADNDLNIPDPVEVPKSNSKVYDAYNYFVETLKESAGLKSSPCDNFYNYTCQNTPVNNYFGPIDAANTESTIRGLKTERDLKWYKTIKKTFDQCVSRLRTPGAMHQNGKTLQKIYQKVDTEFGPSFPLFDKTSNLNVDSNSLGEFVGYLAQKFRLNTFLSYTIQGNHLVLSEPQLAFPNVYFVHSFDMFEVEYKASIRDYMTQLAEALNVQLDESELTQTIDEVVNFEKELAEVLNTVEEETPITLEAADLATASSSINFNAFFARISKNSKKSNLFASKDFDIHVTAPAQQTLVQMFISQSNPKTVLNYLNVRLARSLRQYYMRKPKECKADQWLREGKGVKAFGFAPPLPQDDVYPTSSDAEKRCMSNVAYYYRQGVDRIYLDDQLPDLKERKEFVARIGEITTNIITGFRYQIDKLSWFSPATKAAAYKKIDAMLYNIVYDDWIENDDLLNDIYNVVENNPEDDHFTATDKMNDFAQTLEWEGLHDSDRRHANFSQSIRTVNAWYMPALNHFYIPLGILQRPFFDINYPAALQYSAVGYVVGHEFTHGFDSNGVNYDDQGNRNPWMDNASKKSFNDMATCVINEYNKLHGRGRNTQTEDIADNGGIRAAYNAFKSEQGLNGQDPQLPGAPLNHLSQDQLFFTGFAHVWCSNKPKTDYQWDPHSALLYRVWGTLQNFPAFQTAYNCPVGSVYAPKEHCNVWA
ncbi:unnamed protein product [Bursaphelenchus okinawaensis]|uniref:Peptidase_M13 domain-containing protein n=1 Tax=Bursaphelenchus okinawaensis TaxID=465554 RepID=A0A811L6A4_9BILA|nr:unnamed protein product [Bursaphelenchus okinawaensis]CAG9118364.1 unnamed protein product [Bursaphelenchus okinawaensis]